MSLKPRYRLTLAYDGTDFFGWQKQTQEGQISVQGCLEEALKRIFNEDIQVVGSGRTDRGVHARAQVCHFNSPLKLSSAFDLPYKINQLTPPGITVLKIQSCPPRFHAQLWARGKTYEYFLDPRKRPDPFQLRYSWHYPFPLNLDLLNGYCEVMLGKHDFKSFQTKGTPVPSTKRTIHKAFWEELPSGMIRFEIEGDGFLKQMVRNIVGTQMELLKDERPPEDFLEIIKKENRQAAGQSAPGHGLFMKEVYYADDTERICKEL